jgi:hypothetical protein
MSDEAQAFGDFFEEETSKGCATAGGRRYRCRPIRGGETEEERKIAQIIEELMKENPKVAKAGRELFLLKMAKGANPSSVTDEALANAQTAYDEALLEMQGSKMSTNAGKTGRLAAQAFIAACETATSAKDLGITVFKQFAESSAGKAVGLGAAAVAGWTARGAYEEADPLDPNYYKTVAVEWVTWGTSNCIDVMTSRPAWAIAAVYFASKLLYGQAVAAVKPSKKLLDALEDKFKAAAARAEAPAPEPAAPPAAPMSSALTGPVARRRGSVGPPRQRFVPPPPGSVSTGNVSDGGRRRTKRRRHHRHRPSAPTRKRRSSSGRIRGGSR